MPPIAIQDYFTGDYAMCYGCGSDNAHGLQVRTYWDGQFGTFRFSPQDYHTAFPGVVYGGLIASLFDCHCIGTAIAAAYEKDGRPPGSDPVIMYMTANLNVNYLRPTPMGSELLLKSHIVEQKGKKTVVACTLSADDTPCANATVVGIRATG